MIKRIELVNFMSHERTVIEPSDGLTVLVGPNNCGKSAFVSALQILCHNAKSNYVMRHGEKKCEIIVETDDGHVVQWSRTKSGSPKYVIDGQDFDRLKGGVPDELHEILGLAKVNCEKDQFDVHFGEQKSPVFLLNDSGRASAQFFASSSDAIRLVEMQDRHKGKVRDAKRDQSRLLAEKNRITDALEQLNPIDLIAERLTACEADFEIIRKSDSAIEESTIVIRALGEVQQQLARHQAESECLGELISPPKLADTKSLDQLIWNLERSDAVQRNAAESHVALAKLGSPPELAKTVPLERLIEELETGKTSFERLGRLATTLSRIEVPPATANQSSLDELIRKIWTAQLELSLQQKRAALLGQLKPLPEQFDQTPLESMLKDMTRARKSVAIATDEVEKIDQQIARLETELKNWVQENPNCPTCGGQTTVDQLISSGGHRHG